VRTWRAGPHPSSLPYKNGIDETGAGEESNPIERTFEGEHGFQVMKLQFGFVKLRYRGLKKNAHRLFVTCALVNLFLSRAETAAEDKCITQASRCSP